MSDARVAIVVPLKHFGDSKTRLRGRLAPDDLAQLAHTLALGVVAACGPRPCLIVGDDPRLEIFATSCGAEFLFCGDGLNASAAAGRRHFGERADLVVVAHGDLAHPSGLGSAEFGEGVTIVPDRHGDGTNVLAVPTDGAFDYAYGQGSAARHAQEAARRGWSVTWWRDSPWGLDVDTPDDLDAATT